jgi:hypothetical protein
MGGWFILPLLFVTTTPRGFHRVNPRRASYLSAAATVEGEAWSGTVTLKLATDQQGAVDDLSNASYRFSSPESLDAVHRLRRASDAVLVGVNTVLRDDPSLTVRRVPLSPLSRQPLRVVLDRRCCSRSGALRTRRPACLFSGRP